MFKIVSIDVSGIKEANRLLLSYADAVSDTTIDAKQTDASQRLLESYIARKIGAKVVSGKIGQKQSADYLLPTSSGIIKLLYNDAINTQEVPVEFKGSITGSVTIGQITIGGRQKDIFTPGAIDPFTSTSVKQKILGKKIGAQTGYLVDLDPKLAQASDKSAYIFDTYFRKDPRLKKLFYEKASTMLLGNTYYINDTRGSRLIGLQIPEKYFNNTFFKASIEGKAIVVSIRDNFQNNFIRELNESYLDIKKAQKGYKKQFTVNGKRYTIDYLPIQKGEELFGIEITNSIKARPVDTFMIRAPIPQEADKVSKQSFISGIQWTVLTQKRLGETMLRLGEPEPPELKERSGRFRSSVQVFANYRTSTLQYMYNPLYSSLKRYGYRPDLQVETAIREVAQSLYAQKFNIVRKVGL
jgi:hypothetical protein